MKHEPVIKTEYCIDAERWKQARNFIPPIPSILLDAEGIVLGATPGFCSMLQYMPEELLYRNWREWVSDGTPDGCSPEHLLELARGDTLGKVLDVKAGDGSIRKLHVKASQLPPGAGGLRDYLVHCSDMTAPKLTKESETPLREFLDVMPDGLFISDRNMIMSTNEAGVKMLKARNADELIGRTIFDFFHSGNHTSLAERLSVLSKENRMLSGQEAIMIAPDGTEIPVEFRIMPLRTDDGQPCVGILFRDLSGQKKSEQQLRYELDFSNAIISSMPGIFYQFDAEGRILRWNQNHERVTGYSGDDYSDLHVIDFFTEASKDLILDRIEEVFLHGQSSVQTDLKLKNGCTVPYLLTGVHVGYADTSSFVGVGIDITEFRQAEQALHEQNALFDALLESTIEGILVIDEQGRKRVHNQRLTDLWKIPEHILNCSGNSELFDFFAGHTLPQDEFRTHLNALSNHCDAIDHSEIELTDGTIMERYTSPITGRNGKYYGRIWTFRDVTKKHRAQNHIQHLAHYDMLTGLPNRHSAQTHLDKVLLTPGCQISLLYIDLDGFKRVNDTRGHSTGDTLLLQAAARLDTIGRKTDMFIARLGGDEFIGVTPHTNLEYITELSLSIIQSLSAPYCLSGDSQTIISASVGIALAPDHGRRSGELLSRSDIALYAAKAVGKGTVRIFSPDMEAQIMEQMRIENDLRTALDSTEGMFVFYQPIVDVASGCVTAREALIRWHHPERGWISPADFIPVAENCGLIDRLGLFVLNQACHDAFNWRDKARVAVNISAEQLGKGTIVRTVSDALKVSGLAPDRLEIEVTETALLAEENKTIQELHQIRKAGVHVSLDDFGTGYSSLSHLRIFPFDKIKIDCSFVQDAIEKTDCAAIVRTLADLGRRLGVTTVAEGVETEAHLNCIRANGCTEYQGYFYSRPMPMPEDAIKISGLTADK